MADKILILAGAPESSSLDWNSPDLHVDLQESFALFAATAGSPSNRAAVPPLAPSSAPSHALWRSLSLEKAQLPSGFSQRYAMDYADKSANSPQFFNTSFASVADVDEGFESTQEALSQFYEHSLAIHDEIPSSQLVPRSGENQGPSFMTTESSIWAGDDSAEVSFKGPIGGQGDGYLTDLAGIPQAAHLTKIQPQTMTVNLVVGIISIAAPKAIKTRWGSSRTLVEVLVGDETRSGFAITFWLQSGDVDQSVLAGLRPQDVVLLQNVALNVFVGKVYGSSLRKNLTKVHLLHRKTLDATDIEGYYKVGDLASMRPAHPQLDKTRRVWEWVFKFVGGGKAAGHPWDLPPADTQ